ncbi:hypothetical protein ADIMK_0522 [Marinobacterium lacunae]|uniref:Uncharacterized protein n=1 Tax=Marinobacterium lacunae TaxID=1232683 RepID=A0A081G460_9GAMM|nr:hypothetical protein [Marinobacterium lacunae]KEA65565.1 hypothetical protein ADIMK_0522 [Marinobacterium lacunae]MBR9885952.1 hypothetical protein [Oceanospirillales bacterium]
MLRRPVFVIALLVILGLGYVSWQRSEQQKVTLQNDGFTLSQSLGGTPELVIDTQARQMALVGPDGYERFGFDDYRGANIISKELRETEVNYRIELSLSQQRTRAIRFSTEWEARRALDRLSEILNAQ